MRTGLQSNSKQQLSPLDVVTKKVLRVRKIKSPTPKQIRDAKVSAFKAAGILGVSVADLAKAFG